MIIELCKVAKFRLVDVSSPASLSSHLKTYVDISLIKNTREEARDFSFSFLILQKDYHGHRTRRLFSQLACSYSIGSSLPSENHHRPPKRTPKSRISRAPKFNVSN